MLLVLLFLLAGVIGPMPRYSISSPNNLSRKDSESFLNVLESLTDAKVNKTGALEVLTNGPCFYPAALETMRLAKQSICLEAYVFQRSEIGNLYLEVMTERAKAGVQVSLVLDAFGSWGMTKTSLKALTDAGGRVEWYNKARWYSLYPMDNRTLHFQRAVHSSHARLLARAVQICVSPDIPTFRRTLGISRSENGSV